MIPFQQIAILAPGLLGGSLALALQSRFPSLTLSIYARRESALQEMKEAGLKARFFTDPREAVSQADLTVLCMTVGAMPKIAQEIKDSLKKGSLVTDVGSIKGPLDSVIRQALGNQVEWIGSHPMAGGEKTGFKAASASLFEGATTLITPLPSTPAQVQELIKTFWESVGCKVVVTTPEAHDQMVAQISHLPHLVASALVRSVSSESLKVRGPGFRDTTRVAAGSAEMWTEIALQNRSEIQKSIQQIQAELKELDQYLTAEDSVSLKKWLEKASSIRSQL